MPVLPEIPLLQPPSRSLGTVHMFVFALSFTKSNDINICLHQLQQRPPRLEISPVSRAMGKMAGIAAVADVVKSESKCASLITNHHLLSAPLSEDVFQQQKTHEEIFPDGSAAL
jgi:hypothetical protein